MDQQAPAKALVLTLMALVLSGCSLWGDDMSNRPTITEEQALQRLDQLIERTAEQLDPKPRLERIEHRVSDRHNCLDPSDGGSEDRIVIGRSYWLRDIPEGKNGDIGRQAKAYWESQGHKIVEATGIERNRPDVFAESRDFFAVSVEWSTDGSIRLSGSSPCVWPEGTPEPSS